MVAAVILKFYWLMVSYWLSETQLRKWIWQVSSFIPLLMYSLWDYLVFSKQVVLSLFNSCSPSLTLVSWTSVEKVRLIINGTFRQLRPVYFGKFCEPGMFFFNLTPVMKGTSGHIVKTNHNKWLWKWYKGRKRNPILMINDKERVKTLFCSNFLLRMLLSFRESELA